MKYCPKCLQPDTRPGASFEKSTGVCTACNYHDTLENVDWEERFEILLGLIKDYKGKSKSGFDCLIGVSGGKDSSRQALWVRDKLGLNPLLVCLTFPPEMVTDRGAKNISILINLGFDVEISGPAPNTWKKLVKESFMKFGNYGNATELPLFASVPKVAIKRNIPLIFWGENPALQIGDLEVMGKNGYDGNNLRNGNTLGGASKQWIMDLNIHNSEIIPFDYPSEKEFVDNNIEIIFLGWFLKNWSFEKNGMMAASNGLIQRDTAPHLSGDPSYVSALDDDWVIVNQMVKYYKMGFGKTTEFVNEQIRRGIISRDDGISIVEKYDGACSEEFINSFCEYIEISSAKFWEIIINNTNKRLFDVSGNNITPKFKVGEGL